MNAEQDDAKTGVLSRVVFIVFQVLCWLVALYAAFWMSVSVYGIVFGKVSTSHLAPRDISGKAIMVDLTFWACALMSVAAITRRPWAPHLVRTTATWMLALQLEFMAALSSTLYQNMTGISLDLGHGDSLLRLALLMFGYCGFLVAIIVSAGLVAAGRDETLTVPIGGFRRWVGATRVTWLFPSGLVAVALGLGLRWCEVEPGATYAIIAGAVLIMFGQCLFPKWFVAASALAAAVIILACDPSGEPRIRFWPTWIPVVLLGGVALASEKTPKWLRAAAVAVPIILMIIAATPSGSRLMISRTGPRPRLSSTRPDNFPYFLKVPDGATDVKYVSFRGDYRLSFAVRDPYPATKAVRFISDHLAAGGFERLEYSLLNPDIPASWPSDWTAPRRSGPGGEVVESFLVAEWVNEIGEIVSVMLVCSNFTDGGTAPDDLRVDLRYSRPRGLLCDALKRYKKRHPDKGKRLPQKDPK